MFTLFKSSRKPIPHTKRILTHLMRCGELGEFNYNLARPDIGGLSWHRRITDLRKQGIDIKRIRVTHEISKYYFVAHPKIQGSER